MAFPKLLQKLFQNDGAGDKLNPDILPEMNYLPTSGGTMTGTLVMAHGNNSITGSASDYFVQINAAGNSGGGQLRLYGKDNTQYPGWIFLYVKSGDAPEKALVLKGTGGLEWDGKPVLCGESAGFPVGFIALYSGNNVPNGWFRCDGSTIADMATNYPKLYAVLGTNVLPNSSGRAIYGAESGNNVRQLVAAGLPDVTGTFGRGRTYIPSTGAFETRSQGDNTSNSGSSTDARTISFAASRSNSIYGNSTTVQPPAIKLNVLIKHD